MNREQQMIFELLAEDKQLISYRPSFARMIGSVTSALLLQQIFFRWTSNGCKPFFKFKEPCQHKAYKKGDSWCEELAFGRTEFDGALSRIGTKVQKGMHLIYNWPERKDFDSDEGYNHGVEQAIAHIVCYSTDSDHKTWYFINSDLLIAALSHAKVENLIQISNAENQLRILTENTKESSGLSLSTEKDPESREVEILPEKISEANSKRGEVTPVEQPSLFASSESASPVKTPPVGFKFVTGTNLSEPLHLRRENQTVMAQCLCKAKFPFRLNPVGDMLRDKPICEECLKFASAPKPERAKKERKPNPWDAWGEAIATHLFGAKDKAGVNAVFGRVAPILHGDKRSGNCDGLIAYESERQGKDKADLDYAKLATDTAEFWKWHQRVKPTVKELKVCFKVVDAWQEWRGKQKPALDMSQYTIIEPDNYISPTPAR